MRIMAVDYGDVRTGIAVSDITASLVGDAWVLSVPTQQELAAVISTEALTREVGTIVIGYPRNMDGTVGSRAEKSEYFSQILRDELDSLVPPPDRNIEIKLWDERLTTMSAHRILNDTGRYGKKRKKLIDAVAASLILEGFLLSNNALP